MVLLCIVNNKIFKIDCIRFGTNQLGNSPIHCMNYGSTAVDNVPFHLLSWLHLTTKLQPGWEGMSSLGVCTENRTLEYHKILSSIHWLLLLLSAFCLSNWSLGIPTPSESNLIPRTCDDRKEYKGIIYYSCCYTRNCILIEIDSLEFWDSWKYIWGYALGCGWWWCSFLRLHANGGPKYLNLH